MIRSRSRRVRTSECCATFARSAFCVFRKRLECIIWVWYVCVGALFLLRCANVVGVVSINPGVKIEERAEKRAPTYAPRFAFSCLSASGGCAVNVRSWTIIVWLGPVVQSTPLGIRILTQKPGETRVKREIEAERDTRKLTYSLGVCVLRRYLCE